MADHDMGWPRQGRDSTKCDASTRAVLAVWAGPLFAIAVMVLFSVVMA